MKEYTITLDEKYDSMIQEDIALGHTFEKIILSDLEPRYQNRIKNNVLNAVQSAPEEVKAQVQTLLNVDENFEPKQVDNPVES